MTRRAALGVLGFGLILAGIFLPRDWYDALPRQSGLPPPPIKGVTLLQLSFVLEGLALLWLGLRRWSFTRLEQRERLAPPSPPEDAAAARSTELWTLAAITLLALSLRLIRLDADLWLDEITPILDYGSLSALQVIGTYFSTNNHLLNTLLGKLAVATFGETEWAVRLPAMLFGTATIPALYWVARLALSREASLGAALLLAVSYHHVFFSQNARGYTAYLFFSLVSSGLLVKGLQEDRARTWALYVAATFLNFASLLNAAFVFASHVLVGAGAVLTLRRRSAPVTPLMRRLLVVFGVSAFLAFQLYATILPQAYVIVGVVYTSQATGYAALSGEFLRELVRGVSAGFGTGLILGVAPFLIVGAAGFLELLRRQWALAAALALPGILTALFLMARGLTFSPRFFLLALPLTVVSAVQGLWSGAQAVARILPRRPTALASGLAWTLVLVAAAVSAASLRGYYSVPKQAYRASIEYLEGQRHPGDIVMVVYLAEKGYRYYGRRFGLKEGQDYFFVRSVEAFETTLSSRDTTRVFLVTTFPRALRLNHPGLYARMARDWAPVRTFRGTVGDGEISVWRHRQS